MKQHALAALLAVWALAACSKDKPKPADQPTPGSAGSAAVAPVDAAASGSGSGSADVDPMAAEEAARRNGKATGIASATEKPEVITEDLVRAIGTGKVDVQRFVDPKKGLVERITLPGGADKPVPEVKKRLCGDKAATRAAAYIKQMVEREATDQKDEIHGITCGNAFVDQDDPNFGSDEMGDAPKTVPMKHASCWTQTAGEYDEIMHLEWVPDAERGFRLAAIVSTEGGAINKTLWFEVATEMASTKPCK